MAVTSAALHDLESERVGHRRARARDIPRVEIVAAPWQRGVKRALDVGLSLLALLVLGPLFLLVGTVIRLTSNGPALFRQVRVGQAGRRFEMLKFRSMVADAERLLPHLLTYNERNGPVFKMRRDPRVTRIGYFLRKYSIDELPQLLNVLRGDMSLVGPRPPVPDEVARYEEWQLQRLAVPQGLTCIWQVSANRCDLSFEEWVLLDLEYIERWHLGRDLVLICKTLPAVLSGKGQC